MSESCGVDGGCSHCSFGQRLTAREHVDEAWELIQRGARELQGADEPGPVPLQKG